MKPRSLLHPAALLMAAAIGLGGCAANPNPGDVLVGAAAATAAYHYMNRPADPNEPQKAAPWTYDYTVRRVPDVTPGMNKGAVEPVVDIAKYSYAAADALASSLKGRVEPQQPVIVATLVNIDQLQESSRLGRVVSEQIAARLVQLGYGVVELKLRSSVAITDNAGELMLSRELKMLSQQYRAQLAVVGTYSDTDNGVLINIRAVHPFSNIIMAAHDFSLPPTKSVRNLMLPYKAK